MTRIPLRSLIRTFWLALVFISCKETTKEVTTIPTPEGTVKESLAPQYKEIGAFMDLILTDSTRVEEVFLFKALYDKDSLTDSDAAENLKLYKAIMKTGRSKAIPIFESRASDLSLVLLTGKGYVGPIWARVLFDRKTRQIVRVSFGHKLETEGYGDAITDTAFQEQFSGAEIRLDTPSFALKQGPTEAQEGVSTVDGISGATATSTAVIQLLNSGLKGLEAYFIP